MRVMRVGIISRRRRKRFSIGALVSRLLSLKEETMNEHVLFEAPPGGFSLPPLHPGATLAAEIKARDLTPHALALKLRVPANRISEIIAGKRGISAETALRLGRYFRTGAVFWINLQSQYELALAERDLGGRIVAEVEEAA
jgi:addiction module HigA family antidote